MSVKTNGNSYLIATDLYTSIESRSQNPVFTKSALQIIALLTLRDSSITFSLRETETRPINVRDPLVLLAASIKNPKSKPAVLEETKEGWVKTILKQTCMGLYNEAIRHGKTHPFPLNSAAHRGFVATHFGSAFEENPGFYQEFVDFVGQGPVDMSRLPEIHSFLSSKEISNFSLFDSYIEIISPQPKASSTIAFKAPLESVTEIETALSSIQIALDPTKEATDKNPLDVIEENPEEEYDMADAKDLNKEESKAVEAAPSGSCVIC